MYLKCLPVYRFGCFVFLFALFNEGPKLGLSAVVTENFRIYTWEHVGNVESQALPQADGNKTDVT